MAVQSYTGVSPLVYQDLMERSKTLPTFRRFLADGKMASDAIFKDVADYRDIQLVSHEQFQAALTEYFEVAESQLFRPEDWLTTAPTKIYDIHNPEHFVPFSQKLVLPEGARCEFRGDLHGDLHSLVSFLDELKAQGDFDPEDPLKLVTDVKLIFMGDYVDRGLWGVEIIYLLMLLKIKNPDQVILIRGNHEDPDADVTGKLGFKQEYDGKFSSDDPEGSTYRQLSAFYNSLPVVLYLGTENPEQIEFVQCCHGGMEWGYNPAKFLNTDGPRFELMEEFKRHSYCPEGMEVIESKVTYPLITKCEDFTPITPRLPHTIGFMMNEFNVGPDEVTLFNPNRKLFSCSKELTEKVLAAANIGKNIIFSILRAHQHAPNFPHLQNNPIMDLLVDGNGCVKLWSAKESADVSLEKDSVLTLLLSPDSDSGLDKVGKLNEFTFDTRLTAITAPRVKDWKCTVTNTQVLDEKGDLLAKLSRV